MYSYKEWLDIIYRTKTEEELLEIRDKILYDATNLDGVEMFLLGEYIEHRRYII